MNGLKDEFDESFLEKIDESRREDPVKKKNSKSNADVSEKD